MALRLSSSLISALRNMHDRITAMRWTWLPGKLDIVLPVAMSYKTVDACIFSSKLTIGISTTTSRSGPLGNSLLLKHERASTYLKLGEDSGDLDEEHRI